MTGFETFADENWTLYRGDALDVMPLLDDDSVDSVVTSPPYADQRTYEKGEPRRRRGNNKSRKQRRDALTGFADWLEPFLVEMFRVTKPGGGFMLNLGRVMRDGQESDYAERARNRARELGWLWVDTIVWTKDNGGVHSDRRYLANHHEYAWWLAKPGAEPYRAYDGGYLGEPPKPGYDPDVRTPHASRTVRRIQQGYLGAADRPGDERYAKRGETHGLHPDGARPRSVVNAAVGGTRGLAHSAVMPLPVALYIVPLCTPPGGLVLDPFAGAATTGVAALRKGRRFVGVELEEHHVHGIPAERRAGALQRLERWWDDPAHPQPEPEDQEALPL